MNRLAFKPLNVAALVLIVGFGVYGALGMKDTITPYMDIAQARTTHDRVQVKGKLDKASIHTDSLGRLVFRLSDFKTHETFGVVYSGQHPANMAMARDVVAMGSWDPDRKVFESDQMNIKCPDKYQPGAGTSPSSS